MKLLFHTYFRCTECQERWLVSHDLASILFSFWKVQAEIAEAELDYYNHVADHAIQDSLLMMTHKETFHE